VSTTRAALLDLPDDLARVVGRVSRISAVPSLLQILCKNTQMGFAAVARVTDESWTACAVADTIGFGLRPGGQLDVHTTLCKESRAARQPVVIDQASLDPVYCTHHTPRLYKIESYVSVPIVLADGSYFGNLCAIDPAPHKVSGAETVAMFNSFAQLIADQLDKEASQELTANALLDERGKAVLREQFIAVLGHDLRNPLSSISALATLLERDPSADAKIVGGRIRSGVRRMARLIDDVLDFTRGSLGSGIGVELAAEVDLSRALLDVIQEIEASHPDRPIHTRIDIGRAVVCDRGRLQQLLSNLLGNAVQHGTAGTPINVHVAVTDGILGIAVRNQGTPIPPEHLARMFEPYWRPPTAQHASGGLGLGLSICAQIVKAHGGRIDVTSSGDNGTQFVVRVPVEGRA